MLDRSMFATGLKALALTLGGKVDGQVVELYYIALGDLDADGWVRAVERAVKECKFFPRPAELRELAGEHTAADRCIVAWTEVIAAMSSVGSYRSVDFEDPAINATVRSMGGWVRLCGLPSEELEAFARKDFEKAYRAYAKSTSAEAGQYLPGRAELTNGGRGLRIEAPVRVRATTALPAGGPRLTSGALALAAGGRR